MSLTQQQFIDEVNTTGIPDGEIYIQIEDEVGGETQVLGLAVSVKTKNGKDITNILEQVETVSFTWTQEEDLIGDLRLEVKNKTRYVTSKDEPYFYFQVTPTKIVEPDLVPTSDVRINFFPFITDQQFNNSDFNATINSINNQKPSTFRQVADNQQPYLLNGQVFPLPSNIDLLVQGNATFAQIPDSNYTKIGYTNARYNGSITDDEEFGSIPPGIGIKGFQGTTFSSGSTDDAICGTPQEALTVGTLYHTGQGSLPRLVLLSNADIVPAPMQTLTATTVVIEVLPNFKAKIQKNMLLVAVISGTPEVIRVRSYNPNEARFTVERGVTGPPQAGTLSSITVTDNCQVYRLENDVPVLITESRVLVEGSREILNTDKFGFVTSFLPVVCPAS